MSNHPIKSPIIEAMKEIVGIYDMHVGKLIERQHDAIKETIKMSNHPTIAALKAVLESERERDANSGHYVEGESCPYYMDEIEAYKDGHEAATERLMPLIEKALELATTVHKGPQPYFPDTFGKWQYISVITAREFLTTLADAGVIKKEIE